MLLRNGSCNPRFLFQAVTALLFCTLMPLYAHAEPPKVFPLRERFSQNSEETPEALQKAQLEQTWNLIRWYEPVLLLHELSETAKNKQSVELKAWCESVSVLVSELESCFPASESQDTRVRRIGNGKIIHAITHRESAARTPVSRWDFQDTAISGHRQEILLQLMTKITEGRALQATLQKQDRDAAASLVRCYYTLQRRLILWNYCDAMLRMTPPTALSDASTAAQVVPESDWNAALDAVKILIDAHPYHATWRSYVRFDVLKRFPQLPPGVCREIAWQILERLHPENVDVSQKQFLAQTPFQTLENFLKQYGAVRTASDYLMCAVEDYETAEDVAAGNRLVMEVRRLEMEQNTELPQTLHALELAYRNANMRLYISREFLNSSLPQPGSEERTIQENVLNRPVYGRGISNTSVSVRMVPDAQQFRLGFLVEGSMKSNTYSPNVVTVYNNSDAQYVAFKEVLFSSGGLKTLPAVAKVQNRIELQGLQTPLDPIPVIGFVANGVARNQAVSKQEEVRQMTENKIRNEVCSALDSQVNEKLSVAERFYQEKLLGSLARLELRLEQVDANTTEDAAVIRLRLAGTQHPGAFTPRPVPPADSVLNFQIHESTLNNFLQQFRLDGRTFTVESLMEHIETRFPELKLPENLPEQEEELIITFAQNDAVTVHIEENRFMIRISVQELRVGKRQWKNFEVEVPYFLETGMAAGTNQTALYIQRDGPVRLIGRIPIGQQVAVRGIFSKIFVKGGEKNVLPEAFTKNPRFAELSINQLALQDGWFGVSFGPKKTGLALR